MEAGEGAHGCVGCLLACPLFALDVGCVGCQFHALQSWVLVDVMVGDGETVEAGAAMPNGRRGVGACGLERLGSNHRRGLSAWEQGVDKGPLGPIILLPPSRGPLSPEHPSSSVFSHCNWPLGVLVTAP